VIYAIIRNSSRNSDAVFMHLNTDIVLTLSKSLKYRPNVKWVLPKDFRKKIWTWKKEVLRINCILGDSPNIITVIRIWKINSAYNCWMYERSKTRFKMWVRISDKRILHERSSYKWEFNIKIHSRVYVCVCVCVSAHTRARTNWSCSGCCPVTDVINTIKFCAP